MNANDLEILIIKMSQEELINFLMAEKWIKNESVCPKCQTSMKLVNYKKCNEEKAWRCLNTKCTNYKEYKSVRFGSFFEGFRLKLCIILRIILKYATRQSRYSLKIYFNLSDRTIDNVI